MLFCTALLVSFFVEFSKVLMHCSRRLFFGLNEKELKNKVKLIDFHRKQKEADRNQKQKQHDDFIREIRRVGKQVDFEQNNGNPDVTATGLFMANDMFNQHAGNNIANNNSCDNKPQINFDKFNQDFPNKQIDLFQDFEPDAPY